MLLAHGKNQQGDHRAKQGKDDDLQSSPPFDSGASSAVDVAGGEHHAATQKEHPEFVGRLDLGLVLSDRELICWSVLQITTDFFDRLDATGRFR